MISEPTCKAGQSRDMPNMNKTSPKENSSFDFAAERKREKMRYMFSQSIDPVSYNGDVQPRKPISFAATKRMNEKCFGMLTRTHIRYNVGCNFCRRQGTQ